MKQRGGVHWKCNHAIILETNTLNIDRQKKVINKIIIITKKKRA